MSLGRVLVGGGTGFIGKHLCAALKQKGYEVCIISRYKQDGSITWDELIKSQTLPDCTAVINLAGRSIMSSPYFTKQFGEDLRKSRLETTGLLSRLISKSLSPPKVWISTSAVGIYPFHPTVCFDEKYKGDAPTFFMAMVRDWEASAQISPKVPTRHVIVRMGLPLAKDGGILQSLALTYRFKIGMIIGDSSFYFPWIHMEDATGIYLHAIQEDSVSGPLNAVCPTKTMKKELDDTLTMIYKPKLKLTINMKYLPEDERCETLCLGHLVYPLRTLESGYHFKHLDLKRSIVDILS